MLSPEEIIAFRGEVEALQSRVALFSSGLDAHMDKVAAMQMALTRAENPAGGLAASLHEARNTLLALENAAAGLQVKKRAGRAQRTQCAVPHVRRVQRSAQHLWPNGASQSEHCHRDS